MEPVWPGTFSPLAPLDLNLRPGGGNSDPKVVFHEGAWHLWMSVGSQPPNNRTSICYAKTLDPDAQKDWSPIWSDGNARIAIHHGPLGTTSWQGVEVACPVYFQGRWWAYHLRKPGQGHQTGKYGRWLEMYASVSDTPEGPFFALEAPVIGISLPWEMPWVQNGKLDGGLREIAVLADEGEGILRFWYLATSKVSGQMRRVVGAGFSTDGINVHKLEEPAFTPADGKKCQQIDVIKCPTGGFYLLLVPEAQQVDLYWSADGVKDWIACPSNPIVATSDPLQVGNLGGPTGQVVGGKFHLFAHHGPNHWTEGGMWRDVSIDHAVAPLPV